jgi:hypothetical protein
MDQPFSFGRFRLSVSALMALFALGLMLAK